MRERLYAAFRRELAPIEGIAKTLQALGIPFCVASSSQLERVRLSLEVTGLLELFEGRMFSASMAAQGKPAPDLFLMAAKALGAKPSKCLVIEDSPAGVIAAQRAGMTVFGFLGGSHAQQQPHREALEQLAPALIFSDMSLLPELIAGHDAAAAAGIRAIRGLGRCRHRQRAGGGVEQFRPHPGALRAPDQNAAPRRGPCRA